MNIKMLDNKTAIKKASELLSKAGFFLIRKSKQTGSHYFTKKGSNFKVRLADHKNGSTQFPDVAFNLVFDYPTIQSDVEAQCARVSRDFDILVRNKQRVKK